MEKIFTVSGSSVMLRKTAATVSDVHPQELQGLPRQWRMKNPARGRSDSLPLSCVYMAELHAVMFGRKFIGSLLRSVEYMS